MNGRKTKVWGQASRGGEGRGKWIKGRAFAKRFAWLAEEEAGSVRIGTKALTKGTDSMAQEGNTPRIGIEEKPM